MGNEHSSGGHSGRSAGVPFVAWRAASGSACVSAASSPLPSPSTSAATATPTSGHPSALGLGGAPSCYHFAEPSSFSYTRVPRVVSALAVFTRPAKADAALANAAELAHNIAVVERGGRMHFPDIVRRVLAAGAVGIVFLERVDNKTATQSLFDGFHSSGRQSVAVPIVLLSKFHADQLLADHPTRLSIELLGGEEAIQHMVPDDAYFATATAARAGEVELLKHLLYADVSGSLLEVGARMNWRT